MEKFEGTVKLTNDYMFDTQIAWKWTTMHIYKFVDEEGKVISDVQKIIADKTSENIQERSYRCTFNLKSQQYKNTACYYLVIRNEQGFEISRTEYQINIAFATGEFDFFS